MNPKILLIDTNYPINSRNQRIVSSLCKAYGEGNIGVVAWNRQSEIKSYPPNHFIYECPSPLGQKFKKLKKMYCFYKFLKKAVSEYKPTIIIASHWDSLLVSHRFANRNIDIVYENLDMPSGNSIVRFTLNCIEKVCLRKTKAICYASRFFASHYLKFRGYQITVENKPDTYVADRELKRSDHPVLKIVYNGGLRYAQTMLNLIRAIGNISGITLDIYGGATEKEGEKIIQGGQGYKNITFHGPYKYEDVEKILDGADVIWAVYPSADYNVRYAISNKYHESLNYLIPGIYAHNTSLGRHVETNGIGFVVNDWSVEDIRERLIEIRDHKNVVLSQIETNIRKYRHREPRDWEQAFLPFMKLVETLNQSH